MTLCKTRQTALHIACLAALATSAACTPAPTERLVVTRSNAIEASGVTVVETPGEVWSCRNRFTCSEGYEQFLLKAADHARPTVPKGVNDHAFDSKRVDRSPKSAEQ